MNDNYNYYNYYIYILYIIIIIIIINVVKKTIEMRVDNNFHTLLL